MAMLFCGGAQAAERCPFPILPNAEAPGPRLDSYLRENKVPASARCADRRREDGCEFVDSYGYLNVFGQFSHWSTDGIEDRFLYNRIGERSRRPPLPYGASWDDAVNEVARKLRSVKLGPSIDREEDGTTTIDVGGCAAPGLGDPFWTVFTFGRDGRMLRIKQAVLYP